MSCLAGSRSNGPRKALALPSSGRASSLTSSSRPARCPPGSAACRVSRWLSAQQTSHEAAYFEAFVPFFLLFFDQEYYMWNVNSVGIIRCRALSAGAFEPVPGWDEALLRPSSAQTIANPVSPLGRRRPMAFAVAATEMGTTDFDQSVPRSEGPHVFPPFSAIFRRTCLEQPMPCKSRQNRFSGFPPFPPTAVQDLSTALERGWLNSYPQRVHIESGLRAPSC